MQNIPISPANSARQTMPRGQAKSLNAKRMISLIRMAGPISRTMIAEELSLTHSNVSRLTNQMLADGLLLERPDLSKAGKKGYPSKLLALRPDSLLSAGIFIDPDRILVGVSDVEGNLVSENIFWVATREFNEVLTLASEELNKQMRSLGKTTSDFIGCGISYPGQHSKKTGHIINSQQFAHWPASDIMNDLASFFSMPVFQLNDAKAACLGELHYGACRSYRNFCQIWLSYGIGGAAVIDQKLYLGDHACTAEFGGLFPKSSPRPSGQDLLDTLREAGFSYDHLSDIEPGTSVEPVVQQWLGRACEQLSWLCLVIARTYAPEAIVIGGSLPEHLICEISSRLAATEKLGEDFVIAPPKIIRAMTDSRPHLGAAALPLYSFTSPTIYSKSRLD